MLIEIPQYPGYFLREDGSIFSRRSNKYLKYFINTAGYPCYKLQQKGVQRNLLVHRLLAFIFKDLPILDSPLEVDHINRVRTDFALSNLQVLSQEAHIDKTLEDLGRTRVIPKTRKPLLFPEITEEDIRYWVSNYSWTRAAKELGLSDNGLRKRFTKLTGLPPQAAKGHT